MGMNDTYIGSPRILSGSQRLWGAWVQKLYGLNDVFLAKQCWRLIQEPDSLWVIVLHDTSHTILFLMPSVEGEHAGRDLLLKGTHWQVMNGKEIQVWSDRWIPSLPVGHPLPIETVQVSRNTTVEPLINQASRD